VSVSRSRSASKRLTREPTREKAINDTKSTSAPSRTKSRSRSSVKKRKHEGEERKTEKRAKVDVEFETVCPSCGDGMQRRIQPDPIDKFCDKCGNDSVAPGGVFRSCDKCEYDLCEKCANQNTPDKNTVEDLLSSLPVKRDGVKAKVSSSEKGRWFYRMKGDSPYGNIRARTSPSNSAPAVKPEFLAASDTGEKVEVLERIKSGEQTYLKIKTGKGYGWIFTQDPSDLTTSILEEVGDSEANRETYQSKFEEEEKEPIEESNYKDSLVPEEIIQENFDGLGGLDVEYEEGGAEEDEDEEDPENPSLPPTKKVKSSITEGVAAKPSEAGDAESREVYVINLSFKVDDAVISDTFKECGKIEAIKWEEDNGRFAGRGWLRFKSKKAAEKAIRLSGTKVLGRNMVVRKASDVYCNRLFVRGLKEEATEEEIRSFFSSCGTVIEIKKNYDKMNGAFKGSAFVQFKTTDEGKKGMSKNGQDFMDKRITVEYSRPLKTRSDFKPEEKPRTRVFVSNLDYNIDDDTIRSFFDDCGFIRNIRWSERNGEFMCKGVLEFDSEAAAQKAVEKSGQMVLSKPIQAEISAPPRSRRSESGNTVFLGNLPFDTTEDQIRELTKDDPKSIRLVRDRATERFKGFGFIEFHDKEKADRFVLDNKDARISGRPIRVRECFESPK